MSKKYNIILNELPLSLKTPISVPRIGKIAVRHKVKPEFYQETYVSPIQSCSIKFLTFLEFHEIHLAEHQISQ
jgi:hypothetical protein